MRTCTKCKEPKDESCFSIDRSKKNGLVFQCKKCKNTKMREYRKLYPEKVKAWHKKYRATKKGKALNKSQELKRTYGIDVKQYQYMYEAQNGKCAICNRPETLHHKGVILSLSVDHNHKTGKIRGLLCSSCNQGLGRMKDSKEILLQAALYLEQHSD